MSAICRTNQSLNQFSVKASREQQYSTPQLSVVTRKIMQASNILWHYVHVCVTEKHGLSFLETSALDSSNVELAFQTILTGEIPICFYFLPFFCVYIKSQDESAFDPEEHWCL